MSPLTREQAHLNGLAYALDTYRTEAAAATSLLAQRPLVSGPTWLRYRIEAAVSLSQAIVAARVLDCSYPAQSWGWHANQAVAQRDNLLAEIEAEV